MPKKLAQQTVALALFSVAALAACAREPGPQPKPSQAAEPVPAEEAVGTPVPHPEVPAVPPDAPRLPAEGLTQWEEVLKALPKDAAGGLDWVKAIEEGVITPRPHPDPDMHSGPPFTLDTLVPGIVSDGTPPLDFDIRLTPRDAGFFEVLFPHSSHTLWLNCSSCHPGILTKRVEMAKIFGGEYCGACHGKVAFAPETACSRCHANLRAPDPEAAEAELVEARKSPLPATSEVIEWGRTFYQGLCAMCHGEEGDGKGPFARFLDPKPRDFTEGTFKFRITPSGSLPTDLDLFRTITTGIRGTGMPAWFALPREDRWALVHYIKTFSEFFEEEEPEPPVEIAAPPPVTPELIARGEEVYDEAKCWDCHGSEGLGDGPSADTLEDDWGFPIRPADLTRAVLKSGPGVEDVFRSVSTGLDGTPMPSYGDVLSQEERWALSHYVLSLAEEQKGFGLTGNIAFSRYKLEETEEPPAMFPHWFHRIRFRCAACHPGIFRMKAGSNPITMDALRQGDFCARCHNGTIAWYVGFETCRRCHGGG